MILQSNTAEQSTRLGLILGVLAIGFWSFGSSFIYLGGRVVGVWWFLCLTTLIGGSVQLLCRRIFKGEIRTAVFLPARLWAVLLPGLVTYGLVYPLSLVMTTTSAQTCGVNLINYLWPALTVTFGVLWVPGTRFSGRLAGAMVLSLAGLGLANLDSLRSLEVASSASVLPYLLGLVSAVSWAYYSSMLARWKSWSREYMTCGIGFLTISLAAGVIGWWTQGWPERLSAFGGLMVVLYGLGPLAGGYLLWELAVSRARVETLGMLGAVTPILSMLVLCLFLRYLPGPPLLGAGVLVSAGVALSVRSGSGKDGG